MAKNTTSSIINARESNFELLRIVCMIFIVVNHFITQNVFLYEGSDEHNIGSFALCFCMCAVNAFVMISGYFGIRFEISRLLKLVFQVLFYSYSVSFIFIVWGVHHFDLRKDIVLFFPILTRQYWFITVYVALYIISPFLNLFVEKVKKNTLRVFLIMGFMLFYVWPTFCYTIHANNLVQDSGYGITNFIYFYLLGRYLYLYKNKQEKDGHRNIYLLGYFVTCVLMYSVELALSKALGFGFYSYANYNSLFCFFSAFFLFQFFRNLRISSCFINRIARFSLSVYLLHQAPFIWAWFLSSPIVQWSSTFEFLLLLLSVPFTVFGSATLVESFRLNIFSIAENKLIETITKVSCVKKYQLFVENI